MEMNKQLNFDQNHLNILLGTQMDDVKTHINLESRHSYQSNDRFTGQSASGGESGMFRIAEAFGEYIKNDFLRLRFGSFNAPFGIYNQFRYITPLFTTVVLPYMYEMPLNYDGNSVVPSNGNVMLFGEMHKGLKIFEYYLYVNAGKRNTNNTSPMDNGVGREADTDKGIGSRIRISYNEKYYFGASYYTVHDKGQETKSTFGIDFELILPKDLQFIFEYASVDQTQKKNSYYGRLIYNGFEKFAPFIMYDFYEDESHSLYRFKENRYGVGISYNFRSRMTLKMEYHYHRWNNLPTATASTSGGMQMNSSLENIDSSMLRLSTIFSF